MWQTGRPGNTGVPETEHVKNDFTPKDLTTVTPTVRLLLRGKNFPNNIFIMRFFLLFVTLKVTLLSTSPKSPSVGPQWKTFSEISDSYIGILTFIPLFKLKIHYLCAPKKLSQHWDSPLCHSRLSNGRHSFLIVQPKRRKLNAQRLLRLSKAHREWTTVLLSPYERIVFITEPERKECDIFYVVNKLGYTSLPLARNVLCV